MAAKLTVLLAEGEAERFDAYCRESGHKKSTLIAKLVREHLDAQGFPCPADSTATEGSVGQARSRAAGSRARG